MKRSNFFSLGFVASTSFILLFIILWRATARDLRVSSEQIQLLKNKIGQTQTEKSKQGQKSIETMAKELNDGNIGPSREGKILDEIRRRIEDWHYEDEEITSKLLRMDIRVQYKLIDLIKQETYAVQVFEQGLAKIISEDPVRGLRLFQDMTGSITVSTQELKNALFLVFRDNPDLVWNLNTWGDRARIGSMAEADPRIYHLLVTREWARKKNEDNRRLIIAYMDERSLDALLNLLNNASNESYRMEAFDTLKRLAANANWPEWFFKTLLDVSRREPSLVIQKGVTQVVSEHYTQYAEGRKLVQRRKGAK